MEEKPKVVVTSRSRRPDAAGKQFKFTEEQVRAEGALKEYRERAWKAYQRMSMPTTTEEPWRRTDLRALPADSFSFLREGVYKDLPAVREDLLKPLVADQHGGQIVLTPGGVSIDLDEKIARQGVIIPRKESLLPWLARWPRMAWYFTCRRVCRLKSHFTASCGVLVRT